MACEQAFKDELHSCRQNKFRNNSDLLCTSFLFPCYAFVSGDGVFSRLHAWYFNIRDVAAKSLYVKLMAMKGDKAGPLSVCLNDHLPDTFRYNFDEYELALTSFLNSYYETPSPCELDDDVVIDKDSTDITADRSPRGDREISEEADPALTKNASNTDTVVPTIPGTK